MPDAIWIDDQSGLCALAQTLAPEPWIGVDTEFLRERTFFPKLCLLQLSARGGIWCVDTLRSGSLEPLVQALTRADSRKILHSARQDLEAFYLTTKRVISPVFDTQIAAACIGLKPQIGYADLVKTLLDVTLSKGQTRTDWSKRPLTPEQLEYAADDVSYLGELAERLTARLRQLGREHWVTEDCRALEDPRVYEPDPALAWERLRGISTLPRAPRARAKQIAVWREKLARERNLPRAWILPDAAIFEVAQGNPGTVTALGALHSVPASFNSGFAASLLETLRTQVAPDGASSGAPSHGAPSHDGPHSLGALSQEPYGTPDGKADEDPDGDTAAARDGRPTPEQKSLINRLAAIVDARAAELGVNAEILAPRGELKSLAMGHRRRLHALTGWRHAEIGTRLMAALP